MKEMQMQQQGRQRPMMPPPNPPAMGRQQPLIPSRPDFQERKYTHSHTLMSVSLIFLGISSGLNSWVVSPIRMPSQWDYHHAGMRLPPRWNEIITMLEWDYHHAGMRLPPRWNEKLGRLKPHSKIISTGMKSVIMGGSTSPLAAIFCYYALWSCWHLKTCRFSCCRHSSLAAAKNDRKSTADG